MRKLIKWLIKSDEEFIKQVIRDELVLHVNQKDVDGNFQAQEIGLAFRGDSRTFTTIAFGIPRYDLDVFKEETEE